jgi:mannose/fructose/N-acetylgalactosamine-specific phosphotransferase system component IIC
MIGKTVSRCSTCSTLRWFLTIAGSLIAALYLQPDWAVRVSGLVPSAMTIGLGICGLGSIGFAIGLWRMRQTKST